MSVFTQRHYIAIAKILADAEVIAMDNGEEQLRCDIGDAFIELFTSDNDKFNLERFKKAAAL